MIGWLFILVLMAGFLYLLLSERTNPRTRDCKSCDGTGAPKDGEPMLLGSKWYSPVCRECGGIGVVLVERKRGRDE